MADLTIVNTRAGVAPVFVEQCRIRSFIVGPVAIASGQTFYVDGTTGRALLGNGSGAGTAVFRGIALKSGGPGSGIDGLEEGFVDGYDFSALAYDAPVYLSNNAGNLATAAGTVAVQVGRVVPVSDRDPANGKPSKILYVRSGVA